MVSKKLTNHSEVVFTLPNGQLLRPGQPRIVRDFEKISANLLLQGWINAGAIEVSEVAGGSQSQTAAPEGSSPLTSGAVSTPRTEKVTPKTTTKPEEK